MNINIERPDHNQMHSGILWYPLAKVASYRMKTHGIYAGGYPRGAIVHYTAGIQEPGDNSLRWGYAQGYCFLLIDSKGVIHQAHPINEWGYHAGKSAWKGLSGTVSDELIGIEIACAGKCEQVTVNGNLRYKAWFHKHESEYFGADQVRYSAGDANEAEGWYQKYTKEQEAALIQLLTWLKNNDNKNQFSYDLVLGHDEVAPGRKQDPGASLSMTMPEFRLLLKKSK